MLLRKFSVPHRYLNWLSLSTKLNKGGLLRNSPLGKAKKLWLSWSWVICNSGVAISFTQNKNILSVKMLKHFLNISRNLHKDYNITGDRIYNLDETDNSVGQVAKLSVLR